jgi:hypothetical protein
MSRSSWSFELSLLYRRSGTSPLAESNISVHINSGLHWPSGRLALTYNRNPAFYKRRSPRLNWQWAFSCSAPSKYRAKAAEYIERGKNTAVPQEIREYKNLERRFTEMTDNEEWVEDNFDKVLHGRSRDQNARDAACGRGAHSALPRGFGYRGTGTTCQKRFRGNSSTRASSMGDLLKAKALSTDRSLPAQAQE